MRIGRGGGRTKLAREAQAPTKGREVPTRQARARAQARRGGGKGRGGGGPGGAPGAPGPPGAPPAGSGLALGRPQLARRAVFVVGGHLEHALRRANLMV